VQFSSSTWHKSPENMSGKKKKGRVKIWKGVIEGLENEGKISSVWPKVLQTGSRRKSPADASYCTVGGSKKKKGRETLKGRNWGIAKRQKK